MLLGAVYYSSLWMALGTFPETKATSGKNSELHGNQNLQTNEANQAKVSLPMTVLI